MCSRKLFTARGLRAGGGRVRGGGGWLDGCVTWMGAREGRVWSVGGEGLVASGEEWRGSLRTEVEHACLLRGRNGE